MLSLEPEVRRALALRVIEGGLLRLKWLAAATRFEIALRRHDRALKYAYKYGYNPAQPRVPAGDPTGGRWTDTDANGNPVASRRIRLAGDIPIGDLPEIPKEKPPTSRERTALLKEAARRIGKSGLALGAFLKVSRWFETYSPEIETYNTAPKTLEELQADVLAPAPGYDIHHVVEQTQAEAEGFTREMIDGADNLVRVPRLKHQEINGWYQTKNPEFGGLSPRKYLSGRNWDVKRAVGLEALRKFGVLKP